MTISNIQNIDPSEHTTPGSAREATSNALRGVLETDIWRGQALFNVIVLTEPLPYRATMMGAVLGGTDSNQNGDVPDHTGPWYFLGKIHSCPGVAGHTTPHSICADPCNLSFTADPLAAALMANQHTVFISGETYSGTSQPTIGDVVQVTLSAAWSKYNLQYATYDKLTLPSQGVRNEAQQAANCHTLRDMFGDFDYEDLGDLTNADFAYSDNADYSNIASLSYTPGAGAMDFIQRMQASSHFSTFSEEMLAGLAANAQLESAFSVDIAGDALSYYQRAYEQGRITEARWISVQARALSGHCSFGYWQCNVCPEDGEGSLILAAAGLDPTDEDQKADCLDKVTEEEAQFEHVASRMIAIFGSGLGGVGAGDGSGAQAEIFGQDICVLFEKPADAVAKGPARGNLARQIFDLAVSEGIFTGEHSDPEVRAMEEEEEQHAIDCFEEAPDGTCYTEEELMDLYAQPYDEDSNPWGYRPDEVCEWLPDSDECLALDSSVDEGAE